jgi:SAM-dependent MidA family methyltransferase
MYNVCQFLYESNTRLIINEFLDFLAIKNFVERHEIWKVKFDIFKVASFLYIES